MTTNPNFIAYAVIDRGNDKKASWTRIGAAWAHKKGNGFIIQLEAVPVDGRVVLVVPKPQPAR